MALLPKELLIKANSLYEKKEFDKLEYDSLLKEFIDYTRNHLTTEKMAKYILEKTNNPSSILYLSGDTSPDYLRCLTLHGFKKIFGKKCHDYPIIPHIYKQNINYSFLYGKGITYTNLLDISLHCNESDQTIMDDIINKKYDCIIYGSYHRGMPFYDVIIKYYDPKNIILLCGEDIHYCDYMNWVNKGHLVFVRELN
jgi:succinate dehydrogenase flavin-adding protein (antitoxin of CptAB toxin-antitoxin module)